MATKNEVLKILASKADEYISGEQLANSIGVSRAAIWKAIKTLQKDGYIIDAVTNRGYKLDSANDVLNANILSQNLNSDIKIYYYDVIDSTNTQAKRLLNDGENGTMLVTCNTQTAGRGRQGKSFYSPAMTGVYLSYVSHPMAALQNAVTSTTAAAVAVCRAIEKLTDKKPQIKWVNDVYIDGKKICGILTEAVTDFETQTVTSVIVGIGVNVKTSKFPAGVENASCLNADVKRADLICEIANQLHNIVNSDYVDFINYYRNHSMIIGEDINFIKDNKVTPAKALEIDEFGGLVVELTDGNITTLRSGEISIRKR